MRVARAKRGKTRASESRLVLVLLLIGQGSGARFFNQSQSVAMQNQSNCGITFDTQLKSALMYAFPIATLTLPLPQHTHKEEINKDK